MCEGIVEAAQWPLARSFKGSRPPKEADMSKLEPILRRNPIAYRRLFPECHRRRSWSLRIALARPEQASYFTKSACETCFPA